MMLVAHQFYVRWDAFIYSSGVGIEPKGRQGIRFTLQLQAALSLMVLVDGYRQWQREGDADYSPRIGLPCEEEAHKRSY
jgi:hypothetical protein